MKITWERTIDGYVGYLGHLKVAVLGTRQHRGLFRDGVAIQELMLRSDWGIHFTSPSMPVALVLAILDSLPDAG